MTIFKPEPAALSAEAFRAEGFERGLVQGAENERNRIQSIEFAAQLRPGHEKLIAELKFDGKTTGAEAADKMLAAEKAKGAARVSKSRRPKALR